jgi:hypothetical protein
MAAIAIYVWQKVDIRRNSNFFDPNQHFAGFCTTVVFGDNLCNLAISKTLSLAIAPQRRDC